MKKVWFITGSSSGLGRTLTEAALAAGNIVAATARNPKNNDDLAQRYPEQLYAIQLDVTSAAQIQKAVKDVIARFGRIDVLVNNAGFAVAGAAEAFTEAEVREQFEVNLLAPVEICRAILPYMRMAGSGRILNISSVGGRAASAGISIYQSAKFGLGGFSEALANETAELGIRVTSVEPGGMPTNWAGSSMSFANSVEGYENTVDTRIAALKNNEFKAGSELSKVASAILHLADHPEPPLHLVLGSDALAHLGNVDRIRQEQQQTWLNVSTSTDALNS